MDKYIQLKNVTKTFSSRVVLNNINLTLSKGDMAIIKGDSGVGKSTLLNIIAGLEMPTKGLYTFGQVTMSALGKGEQADIRNTHIGYISQYAPMIPNLTALENINISLMFEDDNAVIKEANQQMMQLSRLFGITDILSTKVKKLSGGERQRVAIIRALIKKPDVIVADEPTNSLNNKMAEIIIDHFDHLRKQGCTIIMASHNDLADHCCDYHYTLSSTGLHLDKK
ncbi:ABC transporter ATP-binding protein [Shouchella tritolerans]|uniref:ABC transporter ATP-binding protein n=1 Tax=Shouchella tritolerans TaxID=2979466 RepID=UPI0021E83558|nr:ABC transporter ATP-binding protein [Shouchella tritolerans]